MVGTSKILTVSYGTFSCTLEGFEDSFSTMKAIAEYFRDLAADDRYFGAEPATPDADMLARIAEREIARRVEARTDATGIVLRAGSALAAPDAQPDATQPAAVQPQVSPTPVQAPAARADRAEMAEAMPGSETEAEASALLAVSEPEAQADEEQADTAIQSASDDDDHEDDTASDDVAYDDVSDDDAYDDEDHDDADEDVAAEADRVVGRFAGDDDDLFVAGAAGVTMPPAAQRPAPRQVILKQTPEAQTDAADESSVLAAVSRAAKVSAPKPPAPKAPEGSAAVAQPAADLQPAAIPAHPDADSVAAKLQRIRAAVGRTAAPAATDIAADTAEEDDTALSPTGLAAIAAATRGAEAEARSEAPAATPPLTQETPAASADAVAEPAQTAEAAPAPIRARVIKMRRADFNTAVARGLLQAEGDAADEPAAEQEAAQEPAQKPAAKTAIGLDWDDDDAADLADQDDLTGYSDADDTTDAELAARLEADTDHSLLADDEADYDDLAALDRLDSPAPGANVVSDLSEEDEAELLAELAEVEREMGLRDDAEAEPEAEPLAFADDDVASQDDWQDADADAQTADAGDPTDVAETNDADVQDDDQDNDQAWDDDAVQAEDRDEAVAEVQAADETDAQDDALAMTPAAALRPRRVQMPQGPDEDEDAVARIMSRADAQLQEPESNRRRDAITQLKAAVAAKQADGSLGETDDSGEIESAFRKDLSEVVRPRRPLTAEARTERPRAAPLKLVASQRVDLPAAATPAAPKGPVVPVRPRRVQAEDAAPAARQAAGAGSFAEFAEEMGAHSLGDLLEAAAAYTAFVEGSEDFSRPQLLNKIKESRDDISREEGLRSFGTLLREGRIMKVRNGRFAVSDETRFHPERRAG